MRYFLIDKVTEVVLGERAQGVKCVTLADPIVHDHFPDYPVMPGALIVEAAAQLGGFLLELTFNEPDDAPVLRALLVQIRRAKFHSLAMPGDRLLLETRLESRLAGSGQVSATVTCEGRKVATASLTFSMRRLDSERIQEQRRYIYKLWTRDLDTPIKIK